MLLLVALAAATAGLRPEPGDASFAGANGKIVFASTRDDSEFDLYTIEADGSGLTRIAVPGSDRAPEYSADGTRIVWAHRDVGAAAHDVWLMDADGTNQQLIASPGFEPTFSADGQKIAFTRAGGLWTVNADGTGAVSLGVSGGLPAWSPDGTKIAYASGGDIWVVGADGTAATPLTSGPRSDGFPNWKPDGSLVVFSAAGDVYTVAVAGGAVVNLTGTPGVSEELPVWAPDSAKIAFSTIDSIWTMNADGSGRAALTAPCGCSEETWPNWQPLREQARTVQIDVKPGSARNVVNVESKGKLPVAVLSSASFDATTLTTASVRFGKTGVEAVALKCAPEDVDLDGRADLVCHFATAATGLSSGDTVAYLTATTAAGEAVAGSDAVRPQ